jgi:ATP/maltotriose-dependent transcriptional regulator MalT
MVLFDRAGSHPIASLGRAAVNFDRGDFKTAAELTERHLRRLPVQNGTERAAALELLIRAQVEAGAGAEARQSLAELGAIAQEANTDALRASASLAAGVLDAALRDAKSARRHLEDAVDLFERSRAPFETGRARIALARVLADLGRPDAAAGEVRRAIDDFTPLVADLELARAQALLAALEKEIAPAPAPIEKGGLTSRELEVLRLISQGLNTHAIAERLFISEHTVHRHVANTLTKLNVSSRSAAVAQAARLGLLS